MTVQTTQDEATLPPPWLAEALLIAQLWRTTGLVDRLQQQVRVDRGRLGRYLLCDFVLTPALCPERRTLGTDLLAHEMRNEV